MCEPILELQSFSYPFGVTVTLPLTFGLSSRIIMHRVFEVGILNLVCGYIMGSRSDAYCFWVSVTLTPASVLEKLCQEGIPNLVCGYILGSQSIKYCLASFLEKCVWSLSLILFEKGTDLHH